VTLDHLIKGLGWSRLQIIDEDGEPYYGSRTVEVEVIEQGERFVIVQTEDDFQLEVQRMVPR
jgi:hypothetical protein